MRSLMDQVLAAEVDAVIPWTGRQMAVAKFWPHLVDVRLVVQAHPGPAPSPALRLLIDRPATHKAIGFRGTLGAALPACCPGQLPLQAVPAAPGEVAGPVLLPRRSLQGDGPSVRTARPSSAAGRSNSLGGRRG